MTSGAYKRSEQKGSGPWPKPPLHMFYVLMETACPYLPGRLERKVMTQIQGDDAGRLYSRLSRAGFRRSHNFAYRPACSGCSACVPVRVEAEAFRPSGSLRRIQRLNAGLAWQERPPAPTREQFALFSKYLRARHRDGQMSTMTFEDYRAMVAETHLETTITEFREANGQLVAACLSDWLEDGPSAVYSFFEPALERRSLGTYMVLWLIEAARRRGLPHVYLGYWIDGSSKMEYKTRFKPIQGLGPEGWVRLSP